jgi:hypothetical protein
MFLISYQKPPDVLELSNTPFPLRRYQNYAAAVQNQHTLNEAIIKASKPPFVSKTQAS